MKTIHPAIAEHVMEENERLREVLRCIADLPMDRCSTENDYRLSAAKAIALGALSQQAEPALAAVPDSGDTFYAGLYKKSAPMWHRLHDLAVSKGYDHVRFAIECAPVYKCDCMGARRVAIDMAGNTIPCECVAAASEIEPAPAQDEREHVPDKVFQDEFQAWWEDHGQFCRAGGGDYERSFAFQAWRHLYPMLMQARAARPAQTEQQPIYQMRPRDNVREWSDTHPGGYRAAKAMGSLETRIVYAAPIAQTEQQPIRLPERKRTDHLPKEYKTMTVVRAGLEAYNRALDDVAALNAAPAQVTAAMWKAAHDSMESDGDLALALQEALNAAHQQSAPQPEQSGLVEAASGALAAIQDALEDAYRNAYPECCGQAHLECCGSPLQEWSEADQKTMERFAPHEKALRAALSAQGTSK